MSSQLKKRARSGTATFKPSVAPVARSWKGKSSGADRVRQIVRQEMKVVVEKKLVDTPSATYACDTTGSVTLINGCAQGTDFTNRVGRKYTNVAVQLEGLVQIQDGTSGPTKARVMLVYDTQPNGALPAITDVLTAASSVSFMNLNNRDRFRVICDWNDVIGSIDTTATLAYADQVIKNVSIYRKVNLETINDGVGATIADIQSGSIFLLTVGNTAAGNGANFIGACRVRFTDS